VGISAELSVLAKELIGVSRFSSLANSAPDIDIPDICKGFVPVLSSADWMNDPLTVVVVTTSTPSEIVEDTPFIPELELM